MSDEKKMTASAECKAAGLKSLAELSELTGRSSVTLCRWHKENYSFFRVVLAGAVLIKLSKIINSKENP
jgi:hypothetical protein